MFNNNKTGGIYNYTSYENLIILQFTMVLLNDEKSNKDLLHMAKGIDIPCALEVPKNPPPWLDKDLFHLGQTFFWNNCYPVLVCSMRSLLIGISLPNLCIPLVLTRRSETKEKARGR